MSLKILEPYNSKFLGKLKNRVVMSAMTRGFANNHLCTDEMAAYYERRAKDGVALILTEGIVIHPSADGYSNVPRIHTIEQANSWKKAIEKIHAANSKVFAQLWHCGRISHPDFTDGITIVSSTNKQADGINRQNNKPYGVPRALEISEILSIYQLYLNAAELAFEAGFDGVQIHMGHGYLIDQFLDARINDRTDKYGGNVENRCRIVIELLELLLQKYDSNKIMIRISPSRMMGGLYEWPDLVEMLNYLIPKLNKIGLKLLDISCANADYFQTSGKIIRMIRKEWPHEIIGGASLSPEIAEKEISDGLTQMVTWGRYILANPEFISKIKAGIPLAEMTNETRATLY